MYVLLFLFWMRELCLIELPILKFIKTFAFDFAGVNMASGQHLWRFLLDFSSLFQVSFHLHLVLFCSSAFYWQLFGNHANINIVFMSRQLLYLQKFIPVFTCV